ncbi:hypothetical protein K8B33_07735 [Alcanivorax sp. JB21]|uniref:hypothetical protein n=1 Tax=Alcanivorax limicola TaxID=2874102 RepID=UPI001CC1B0FD|nr:hypothetical protein [Alcanivorax limicola]MBZ2188983.1 hypothetical protein [Alcanivorax limicola]
MFEHMLSRIALLVCALLIPIQVSASPLISRTINIDGNMSDWYAPTNITTHPGQFSEDCQGDSAPSCDLDYPVGSTGRDLRKFSYTWDEQYLYFYVERWASATNTVNWLFYLDENSNGRMEAGERILRVDWSGSNRRTNAYLCPYYPDDPAGDPLVSPVSGAGDGYTLPGTSSNGDCTQLYSNVVGGAQTGTEMEARLAWAQLGMSGPRNLRFHISSSRGMNLPSQIEDNMDGPGGESGGGLFPPDMALSIEQMPPTVTAGNTFTVDVQLRHIHFDDFSDIAVQIAPSPLLEYVAHTAPPGTTLTDSNGDGVPDRWLIPLLQEGDERVLQLVLRANSVTAEQLATLFVEFADFTGRDSNADNNQDLGQVLVIPGPQIAVSKQASVPNADPGELVRYTVHVENIGTVEVTDLYLNTAISRYALLKEDGYGAGAPIHFVDGEPVSGLAPGAISYSDNNGLTYDYVLQQEEDPAVTHFLLEMPGVLLPGRGFTFSYYVRIRH